MRGISIPDEQQQHTVFKAWSPAKAPRAFGARTATFWKTCCMRSKLGTGRHSHLKLSPILKDNREIFIRSAKAGKTRHFVIPMCLGARNAMLHKAIESCFDQRSMEDSWHFSSDLPEVGKSEYESDILFPAVYMDLDWRSSGKQNVPQKCIQLCFCVNCNVSDCLGACRLCGGLHTPSGGATSTGACIAKFPLSS